MNNITTKQRAYIYNPVSTYCLNTPFEPPEQYAEMRPATRIDKRNEIYAMAREIFVQLKMDKKNQGTINWNPLSEIIKPGDKVLIKPNLVTHYHYLGKSSVLGTIVHGSILRPIIDYVYLALNGKGAIIVADNPIEHAEFKKIMHVSQIQDMVMKLQKNDRDNLQVMDLRPKITDDSIMKVIDSAGDPLGYATIDVGSKSCFVEFDDKNVHYYTLADKTIDHLNPDVRRKSITDTYHNPKCHKYVVAKSILNADVIINVAKLKTHCKAGVSLSLKNMIGIVSTKDCMPHHRPGSPPEGDAFPDKPPSYYTGSRKLYRNLRKNLLIHKFPGVTKLINLLRKNKIVVGQQIEHGEWKGNDTLWRTILDVNRIAVYTDKNGIMRDTPQRKFFHIIDGIIGQEGDAPISGTPKPCGVLIAGFNPVMVDALACKIMGIDYRMIKTITEATKLKKWPLLTESVDLSFPNIDTPNLHFELPKGWR